MTKTIDVDISIKEILNIVFQQWKLIIIATIVCAILGGGYGLHKASMEAGDNEPVTDEQMTQYEEDMSNYEAYQEAKKALPRIVENELKNYHEDMNSNPIHSLNSQKCEYEQIVIRFEGGGNYDKTVGNWIAASDAKRIFGDRAETLADYKSSLIFCDDNSMEPEETTVQILSVDGFDTVKATEYLVSYFKNKAASEGLEIRNTSTEHFVGYNKRVATYQREGRDAVVSIYNSMNSISNMKSLIEEPISPQGVAPSQNRKVIKFGLAGIILGFILGTAIAVFLVLRRGCVISKRQMEDLFGTELLSDFYGGSDAAPDVLGANLKAMTEEGARIAIVGERKDESGITELSRISEEHEFTYCCNIFDDPEEIDRLEGADAIVLSVKTGSTRIDYIQRVLLKADRLNKPVLGYILV